MKRASDRSSQSARRISSRSLKMEPLEDRMLLAVWGGFSGTAAASDLYATTNPVEFERNVDLIEIADVNSDGKNDLLAVNYAQSTITVYLKTDSGYEVSAGGHSALAYNGNNLLSTAGDTDAVFGDFNKDGTADLLVAKQMSGGDSTFSLFLFTYNKSTGSFSYAKKSDLLLDKYTEGTAYQGATGYYVTSVEMVQAGDSDVAIRLKDLYFFYQGSYQSNDNTLIFTNNGSGGFTSSQSSMLKSGTTPVTDETLIGTTKLNNQSFLVTYSSNNTKTAFNFYTLGSTTKCYSVTATDYLGSGIVSGCNLVYAGKTGLVVKKAAFNGSAVTMTDSEVLSSKILSGKPAMAVGDVSGDGKLDLFCVNGTSYEQYNGNSASELANLTLQASERIANPEYLATYTEGNYLYAVGEAGIWRFDTTDGTLANRTLMADFSQNKITNVSGAVFGLFASYGSGGNDANVDVAVLTKDGVYFYIQTKEVFYLKGSVSYAVTIDTSKPLCITSGSFLADANSSQVLLSYWDTTKNQTGIVMITPAEDISKSAKQVRYAAGEITALTAGTGAYADAAYTAAGKVVYLTNTDGVLNNWSAASISVSTGFELIDLAIGNANAGAPEDGGDDIVFLFKQTSKQKAGIGVILSDAAGSFSGAAAQTVLSDSPISGDAGGLTLLKSDILTAVFTVTKDGKSQIYTSKWNEGVFTAPAAVRLSGDYKSGIAFGSTGNNIPGLMTMDWNKDGLDDLVLSSGKMVVVFNSYEYRDADGDIQFVITALDAANPAGLTLSSDEVDARNLDWLDEWSTFYVEIWAGTNTGMISSFSVNFAYNDDYFVVDAVDSPNGFTVSKSAQEGQLFVDGTADTEIETKGERVLLARVKMKPVDGGAISLDSLMTGDKFVFSGFENKDTFQFAAGTVDSQSINYSGAVATSSATAEDSLVIYPVRMDYDDSGLIDINDFSKLAVAFNTYPTDKLKSFDVMYPEVGLIDINDFTKFAVSFGCSANGISQTVSYETGRFYDYVKLDPTDWWMPAAKTGMVLTEALQPAAAEEAIPNILMAAEAEEADFLEIASINELAAVQTMEAASVSVPVFEAGWDTNSAAEENFWMPEGGEDEEDWTETFNTKIDSDLT